MNRTAALLGLLLPFFAACSSDVKLGTFNAAPTATITSHSDGDSVMVGEEVVLVGNVSDADNAAGSLAVTWIIGGLHTCTNAEADDSGLTGCIAIFEEGKGEVSLQAKDPGNEVGTTTITLNVIPNEAPLAQILAPVDGQNYYVDQLIPFQAQLSDAEDAVEYLIASWHSSLDGGLPLTASPDSAGLTSGATNLTQGAHLITLTATDTANKTGTDTVTITVGPPNTKPGCAITNPTDYTAGEQGALVQFEGLVSDVDITPDLLTVEWSSDKDGALGASTPDSYGEVAFPYDALTVNAHVITMTVSDEVGATCTDFITFTVGTPPTITLSAPVNGSTHKLGDFVAFQATVSDPDEPPTALSIQWFSSIDGLFSTQGADSTGAAIFQDANLSQGNHGLTVTVTDATGLFATAITNFEIIPNTAPSIASVDITPKPAYVDDTLSCSYTGYTDAEGDPDLSTMTWTIGGVVMGTTNSLSGSFQKGDKVTCTVTPSDGAESGVPVSANRTIKNSPPRITTVDISPGSPSASDTLTCSYSGYDDADGDSDASTTEWFVNGVSTGSGNTLSSGFAGGDTVTCTVTPDDGSDQGTEVSDSVTVGNSAPSIATVSISPDPAYVTDSLGCSYTGYSDPDGDPDASTFEWFINSVSAGNSSTLTSGFIKGDQVTCTVTPDDGTAAGSSVSASLVISNTAPVASGLSISPGTPVVSDTLDCSYSFFDADGDGDESTFEWTIGGTSVGTGTSLSGVFTTGDVVICTVTPTDDEDSGTPESASVTIGNTAPSATDVSISPDPAVATDTLSCNYTFDDPDGDADNSTVAWLVNSTSAGSGTTLAGAFVGGDLVECVVSPSDGSTTGSSASASIVIDNTAPTAPTVEITPTDPGENDALLCSVTVGSTDIDNDSVDYSFVWTYDDGQGTTATASSAMLTTTVYPDDTVLDNQTQRDETWTCTVTPNDSTDDGPSGSDSVLIDPLCWSLDFDGTDDSVDVVNHSDLYGMSALTITSWGYADAYVSWNSLVNKRSDTTSNTDKTYGLSRNPTLGDVVQLEIHTTSGLPCSVQADGPMPVGRWVHYAGVYDGASLQLYINGQLQSSTIACTGDIDSHTGTDNLIRIGGIPGSGSDQHWDGMISDTRIYDRALSESEVQNLVSGVPDLALLTGRLAHWDFGEGSGTTTTDLAGNSHDGAIVGAQWVAECPQDDLDEDGYSAWEDCDDTDDTVHEYDGSTENCPGMDCWSLLEDGYAVGDGSYWIDPQLDGTAFEAHCLMDTSYDGGGWTLSAVSSLDGQDTWTWDDRALWDTDTTPIGNLGNLDQDFKSPAHHEATMRDLLFVHSTPSDPSNPEWAGYNEVGDGTGTLADLIANIGGPVCQGSNGGYPLTAGTITVSGTLCSTNLFFNSDDWDGDSSCGSAQADATWGPAWSASNNHGCSHDDPGTYSSLGPTSMYTGVEYHQTLSVAYGVGFGVGLGLNSSDVSNGENHMWVLVRDRQTDTTSLEATADTYVSSSYPTTNYGTSDTLILEPPWYSTDTEEPYLKFDLSSIPSGATVTEATLTLISYTGWAYGGDGHVYVHLAIDDTWTETGLTFNNAPGYDPTSLGRWWIWYNWNTLEHTGSFTSPSTTHGDGLRAAVQSEVAGDGLISFHLSSPGYITHYRSREYSDATKRPTLSVTYFEP